VTLGCSNSIEITNHSNIFSDYYKAFKDDLFYEVFLKVKNAVSDVFLVNGLKFPVGFLLKNGNGIIALLPKVKLNEQNIQKFFNTIIRCCKPFLTHANETPPPEWLSQYILAGEKEINSKIEEFEEEIKSLGKKKEEKENERSEIIDFKKLLYEKGRCLEEITIKSFKCLGFNAEGRKEDDLEHDIVFSSDEGRGVAEIEGKDYDAIHIDKLDQLSRVVDEDFEITGDYPAGIMIGNHYRFTEPDKREQPFTEKVHKAAFRKNFGLLTTLEIYQAIEYILKNPNDEEFKKQCREAIFKTTGKEIKFVIPQNSNGG
jgi:hypothetical protein